MSEVTDNLSARVSSMPIVEAPSPWVKVSHKGVSQLQSVGYGRASDYLLIDHYDGPEVIEPSSGKSLEISDDEFTWDDRQMLQAQGFGPLAGEIISMAGAFGGGLSLVTSEGWALEAVYLDCVCMDLVLVHPDSTLINWPNSRYKDKCDRIWGKRDDKVIAYGFSFSGNSFVIATESDYVIYAKKNS